MVVQEEKFNYGVLLDTAENIFINRILKSASMFLRLLIYIYSECMLLCSCLITTKIWSDGH